MCKIREMNLETAKYYGYEAQSNQLVEECAELIQAVNKYRRVETGLGQPVPPFVFLTMLLVESTMKKCYVIVNHM